MNILPIKAEIEKRIALGHSLRMIATELGVHHKTLSKAMKGAGIQVPSRTQSAKNTWKNHKHPCIGKRGKDCPIYGRKQPKEVIEKRSKQISGPKNYHWSGGRKKHSQGYVLIYVPDHPHCDRQGFILEHRYIMEQHIGRILNSSEIVHHKNGIKSDNRIDNLELTNRKKHAKTHMDEIKGGIKHAQLVRAHGKING